MQEMREFDYLGFFLFIASSVLFLLGLSWGGQLYTWDSINVLTTLIIGAALLIAFVCWGKCHFATYTGMSTPADFEHRNLWSFAPPTYSNGTIQEPELLFGNNY